MYVGAPPFQLNQPTDSSAHFPHFPQTLIELEFLTIVWTSQPAFLRGTITALCLAASARCSNPCLLLPRCRSPWCPQSRVFRFRSRSIAHSTRRQNSRSIATRRQQAHQSRNRTRRWAARARRRSAARRAFRFMGHAERWKAGYPVAAESATAARLTLYAR